jgi:hypothetical protein
MRCKKIQKNLPLYLYNELDEVAAAEVKAHLTICHKCQKAMSGLQLLHQRIPRKPLFNTKESAIAPFRNVVLAHLKKPESRKKSGFSFTPRPAFLYAMASILLFIGFFAGRFTSMIHSSGPSDLGQIIAARQSVKFEQGVIQPSLLGVERIQFDPESQTIEIKYSTFNDIRLRSRLDQPGIQEILSYAMLQDESPAVRLHAVKALRSISDANVSLDAKVVDSLEQLVQREQNAGIKLTALRVLKTVPANDQIKKIFTYALLYDKSTAIRIAAFEGLAREGVADTEIESILQSVKADSSQYFQSKTQQLLKNRQNTTNKKEELL